ncbi:MAG: hypothetical protein AAGA48_08585 [Myxococcota bacterium]
MTQLTRVRELAVYGVAAIVFLFVIGWLFRTTLINGPFANSFSGPRHYIPIDQGVRLFSLQIDDEGTRYALDANLDCIDAEGKAVKQLSHNEQMYCASGKARAVFEMDMIGGSTDRLLLTGMTVTIPPGSDETLATMGIGRDNDVVVTTPGMGATHIVLLGLEACESMAGTRGPGPIVTCVRNDGPRDGLIIDSTASCDGPQVYCGDTFPRRIALGRGSVQAIRAGDWLWAGHLPFQVDQLRDTHEGPEVRLAIPHHDAAWQRIGGERRWMALSLPQWPLSRRIKLEEGREYPDPQRIRFFSRRALFRNAFGFWVADTHTADERIEWQLEEHLQKVIDNELLCLETPYRAEAKLGRRDAFPLELRWNFDLGVGCDGQPTTPPTARLVRLARNMANDRSVREAIERAKAAMRGLPFEAPRPEGLPLVFDWATVAHDDNGTEVIDVVPTRLLGVHPLSTRNSPRTTVVKATEPCDVAKSDDAMPPVSVRQQSTSPTLSVVQDADRLGLRAGTSFLLASPAGSLCAAFAPGRVPIRQGGTLALGNGRVGNKQFTLVEESIGGSRTACLQFAHRDGGTYVVSGPGNGTVRLRRHVSPGGLGDVIASWTQLEDGDVVVLSAGKAELHLAARVDRLDLAAYSVVADGTVKRHYPFGEALAPLLGVRGVVPKGLETWIQPEVVESWRATWRNQCRGATPSHPVPEGVDGIQLTIRGDLQRLVYGELEARRLLSTTELGLQAVLLDGHTGDVLAAANAQSFDPNNINALEKRLRDLRALDGGLVRVPPEFDNLAFNRDKQVGSVYKLATSYAMANSIGLRTLPLPETGCDRIVFAEAFRRKAPLSLRESIDCGSGRKYPESRGAFEDAFRGSWNPYFALAAIRMTDPNARVEGPLESDPAQWYIQLSDDLDPTTAIALGHPMVDTLLTLSHRMHYSIGFPYQGAEVIDVTVDGGASQQWNFSDTPRWLPGVDPQAFSYPSFWGPELYTVGNGGEWARERRKIEVAGIGTRTTEPQHIAEFGKVSYGFGGVQASALSMAVLGTPMVDGAMHPPRVLVLGDEEPSSGVPVLDEADRRTIQRAMERVLLDGTASGFFGRKWAGLGGKTGTYAIEKRKGLSVAKSARDRQIYGWACGAYDAQVVPDAVLETAFSKLWRGPHRDRLKRWFTEEAYRGFAADAPSCDRLNPNRPGVSRPIEVEPGTMQYGGDWLEEHYRLQQPRNQTVPGSAMLVVAFDSAQAHDDPLPKHGLPPGWILAVIADDDGSSGAAKSAARNVVRRLGEYLSLRDAGE